MYKRLASALIGGLKSSWAAVGQVGSLYADMVVKISQELLSHTVKAVGEFPRALVQAGGTDSLYVSHRRDPDEPQPAATDMPLMIRADQRDHIVEEVEEVIGFQPPVLKIQKIFKVMGLAHVSRYVGLTYAMIGEEVQPTQPLT